nr:tetratricopeptide repeat protein [Palleronia sp. THAF1]
MADAQSPPPVDRDADAVDGLIVGHRLMAAGEYELARKAYLRSAIEVGMTVDVLSALGSTDLRMGRLGQAEGLFRRAIKQDPTFVPALNNLGVVLMETDRVAEASRVFRAAFAADSGQSDDIRANLVRALALLEEGAYTDPDKPSFALVRRGNGDYLLLGRD